MRPLPETWRPWREPSPLGDRRPTKDELARAVAEGRLREDVLPFPTEQESAGYVDLLIVGINPSPWTAVVNAPFARPGNRFWPSLAAGGIVDRVIDASHGLSPADERLLAERGIGMTNLVARPTARADQLSRAELVKGGRALVDRVRVLQPQAVAIVGVTAFRTAFKDPKARLGPASAAAIPGWPPSAALWILPNPSGLNAHETVASLGEKWAEVRETLSTP